MTYIPPTSFYDIFPNDYLNWNFVPPVGNFAGGAPAGTPRYGLQYPGGGGPTLVPLTAPVFHAPAPVERTSSAGSSTAQSAISSHPTPSGSATPSYQDMAQFLQAPGLGLGISAAAPPARRNVKRTGPPRRRGPNKRRPGSGYIDMMNALPEEVQNALQQDYANCCEVVRGKDPSTVQKHRFTKRHFNNLDPQYRGMVTSFICPAFVGLDEKCKSAKFGRYDSTERHCNNCPGFAEMLNKMKSTGNTLYPFSITKEEYDAFRAYRQSRTGTDPDPDVRAPAVVERVLLRLLTTLTGATCLPKLANSESQPEEVPEDAEPVEEQPSPSSSSTDPSPSVQPQQLELPFPTGPIYDFTGVGGAASQVAAPVSWPDAVGTFTPGLILPPYGLYPANANPSTWPNVDFDPAAFRTF
ncbi:hypothetical protein H4582DRAFT_2051392 [Lactarius indigo]|nr:hypothetical protein H4582DRAFT_2051392 [Lactarius indigo]